MSQHLDQNLYRKIFTLHKTLEYRFLFGTTQPSEQHRFHYNHFVIILVSFLNEDIHVQTLE